MQCQYLVPIKRKYFFFKSLFYTSVKLNKEFEFEFWCLTPLSAISWRPILVVEEVRVPEENH
jgi:hypothetical protein